jgi:phage terminase small subunit
MAWKPLNEKQRAFVREYLVDLNASKAYVRAGYTAKSKRVAESAGARLLSVVEVKAEVDAAMEERGERTKVTADRVLLEIERMAFFDPIDLVDIRSTDDIKRLPPAVRRCIVGWDWKGKYADRFVIKLNKEKALELLGRHHGLFDVPVEVPGGEGGGSIVLRFVPAVAPAAKGKS